MRLNNTSFIIKFDDIYNTEIHYDEKAITKYLKAADLSLWSQMLGFVVRCASAGCGVAIDMFNEPLFKFHVIFTIHRLLYEMGVAVPSEDVFDARAVKYNKRVADRIIKEFGADQDAMRGHQISLLL